MLHATEVAEETKGIQHCKARKGRLVQLVAEAEKALTL